MYRINSEAKVPRSTRSLVIGTAKVMSYEDLDKARAARVAKDEVVANKGKRKRSRQRKVLGRKVEGDVESDVGAQEETGLSIPTPKEKKMRSSTGVLELEPWRAPVAMMYK